jgi:hypothetical protein
MDKGTPGTWDGEKWIPLDHEQLRAMVVDILIRDVSPVLELPRVREIVRDELASHIAAALADPDMGNEAALLYEEGNDHDAFRAASKALAGYLLERVSKTKAETS